MTKAELIEVVWDDRRVRDQRCQHCGAPNLTTKRHVLAAVEATFAYIADYFARRQGGKKARRRLTMPGFGTFERRWRAPRKGRDPQTGREIEIPGNYTVAFRPAADLRRWMNGH